MDKFKDIRPYYDHEVEAVLADILADAECLLAVAKLKFPRLAGFLPGLTVWSMRAVLKRQLRGVNSVDAFQGVVEQYMDHMIESTMDYFSVSGVDGIKTGDAHVYMSNHRDIVLDPAFVNYALYHNGLGTVRIAIGDNLLTKPYVSSLMRLNKSFIVKRGAKGPRQLFAILKKLSDYIRFSVEEEKHSVWIAHREGRAKDGKDRTEPAILKMMSMAKSKTEELSDLLAALKIVPVAISYEFDPCDINKAKELYARDKDGVYEKGEQEDINSIALGIAGDKGDVHLAFGTAIEGDYVDADAVAAEMDRQIINSYVLHPSNYFAYQRLNGVFPEGLVGGEAQAFKAADHKRSEAIFEQRLQECPEACRPYLLANYANAIVSKIELGFMQNPLD